MLCGWLLLVRMVGIEGEGDLARRDLDTTVSIGHVVIQRRDKQRRMLLAVGSGERLFRIAAAGQRHVGDVVLVASVRDGVVGRRQKDMVRSVGGGGRRLRLQRRQQLLDVDQRLRLVRVAPVHH